MDCDPNKIAILRPEQDHPFQLTINGHPIKVKGNGKVVARVRERLAIQGMTRKEMSKGGRQRGQGYKRVHRRRVTMDTFKRTYTRQAVAQILKIMADRKIGTLELHLPNNPHTAAQAYLSKAGAPPQRPESWPWEFLKTELQQQSDRHGLTITNKNLQYPQKCPHCKETIPLLTNHTRPETCPHCKQTTKRKAG